MKYLFTIIVFSLFSSLVAQDRAEVFFEFDRYDLNPSEQQKLETWITENPKAEVTAVYGYCDRIGTLNYNDSLSLRRAQAVTEFLRSRNTVFASNFTLKGYGESFPMSRNHWENRKVALWYNSGKPIIEKPKSELSEKVKKAVVGDKIKLDNINFYNMSDQIVANSAAKLKELLAVMRDNPNLKIQVQGHICCQTVREKDYSYVSTMRAKAIYEYLIRNGIAKERLSYKGFGVSRPIHPIPEKTDREADENRRVEIEVVGIDS
ncbi:MAG: OmpA family protein [Flavobacterium sp.]|uniref:OmpA family protein n=1 Tax=Flavobacterium sp. TaxID=239 RepID=UPI00121901A8|nr:OmpA family protein [Flavobacterium sp.]RZJ67452.1 MAG: OmpA family protein [Flavobacterium sp.]